MRVRAACVCARGVASFGLVVCAAACAGGTTSATTAPSVDAAPDATIASGNLIAPERYVQLEAATDPLAAHRSAGCALGSPRIEDGTLEFETDDCLLFWVGVPLTGAVRAGERLRLVRTHSALVSRTPGDAHVRVDLDGDVLLDRTVPIPSSDAIDVDSVSPARDHAAGALLRVHLHNHGANNWRVVALER